MIKHVFCLLDFKEDTSVVIADSTFSSDMGVDDIEADHVTLVLPNISPRSEVQLLKHRHPESLSDVATSDLTRVGFNPICFAVDDLDAEVTMLTGQRVQFRNEVMAIQGRNLVFLCGPEGTTVEMAQWVHTGSPSERLACWALPVAIVT